MRKFLFLLIMFTVIVASVSVQAGDIPRKISYQGYVKENGAAYTGTGYFLFAITDSAGTTYHWTNDGDSPPDSGVPITVIDGVFSLLLGDTSLTNMTTIGTDVFTDNSSAYLRVWCSTDGTTYEEIIPKNEIGAASYAYNAYEAFTIDGGTVTASDVTVGSGKTLDVSGGTLTLSDNQISGDAIEGGTIGSTTISSATITQLAGAMDCNSKAMTNVNIDSGTVDNITSLTATTDLDIGDNDLRAQTLTADGLTSGRVVFATTNGQLTDDSHLTFDTDTLTATKIGATEFAAEVGFTQQETTGDGTTTIDWSLGNKYKLTFGAQNETFTFTAPNNPCNLTLILIQDATGSRTVTWSTPVEWVGASAPTLSTGANDVDIVSFYYDGSTYYGMASLNFD